MSMTNFKYAGALLAGLLLSACGGGTPVSSESIQVPAAALASPEALVNWTAAQPASETREPLNISAAMPPTSETDEPLPLR